MTEHNGIVPTSFQSVTIQASPSISAGKDPIVSFKIRGLFADEFTPDEAEELAQALITAAAKARTEQNLDPHWIYDDEFIKIWHEKQATKQVQV